MNYSDPLNYIDPLVAESFSRLVIYFVLVDFYSYRNSPH